MRFTALEKRDLSHRVTLEVLDAEEAQGVVHAIPLLIKGEAYKIETFIKFPQVGERWEACEAETDVHRGGQVVWRPLVLGLSPSPSGVSGAEASGIGALTIPQWFSAGKACWDCDPL